MFEKELAKRLILEYQQYVKDIPLVKRDIEISYSGNYVFVGLRRAGKSYLMYQCVQYFLEQGYDERSILYFNFEDDRITNLTVSDLDLIKLAYEEMYDSKPIFFLDEIQIVEGWEKFARRLADTGYHVFITGSNAKMLSSDIATTLGGRYFIQEVFPFSFAEYIKAQGIVLKENWQYRTNTDIVRIFDGYFRMGGLPELLHTEEKFKRPWLSSLFNKIYFGDLLARHNIRNNRAMKLLIRKLAENIKQPLSFNRAANIVSSVGGRVKSETMAEYLSFLKDSWLILPIENYTAKLVDKHSNCKYYFADNGVLSLFLTDPNTSLLENIVAIQLRRTHPDELTYYFSGIEVDFFLYESRIAYQVSYSLRDTNTREREINALLTLNNFVSLKKMYIITKDEEEHIEIEGQHINVIPVWKWLLS